MLICCLRLTQAAESTPLGMDYAQASNPNPYPGGHDTIPWMIETTTGVSEHLPFRQDQNAFALGWRYMP